MHNPVAPARYRIVSALCALLSIVACAAALRFAAPARSAAASTAAVPADFVNDPLMYVFDARIDEANRYGDALLRDPSTTPAVRQNVLVALGTARLAKGDKAGARDRFQQVFVADATAELDDPCRLPDEVRDLFYRLRYEACAARLDALIAAGKLPVNISTVAVGEIENNSISKASYDVDHFCRGLRHILTTDLQNAISLKVVDRAELSVLLAELDLNKDPGKMDPQTRVRLGQLSGAQSYLFGQFMQVDRTHVRMDLRWVNTATSEILLAKGVEGTVSTPQDLFKFEKRLLMELVPQLQKLADSTQGAGDLQKKIDNFMEQKRRSLTKDASYVKLVETYGQAIASEGAGDYDAAVAAWDKVGSMSPHGPGFCGGGVSGYRRIRRG